MLTLAQVVEDTCVVSVQLPQTTCFSIGDSKMPKMTVRCGGSAESADIFRSFSFCSAWRRLAQFCSKKIDGPQKRPRTVIQFCKPNQTNGETTVFATIVR